MSLLIPEFLKPANFDADRLPPFSWPLSSSGKYRIRKGVVFTTPKTLNELRTMLSVVPFRDACVTCNKARGEKWRITKIVFTHLSGDALLESGEGFVLLTQRGEEKLYATLDPIGNDFSRVIGIPGYVTLKAVIAQQPRSLEDVR
jgi:hypothetical protein